MRIDHCQTSLGQVSQDQVSSGQILLGQASLGQTSLGQASLGQTSLAVLFSQLLATSSQLPQRLLRLTVLLLASQLISLLMSAAVSALDNNSPNLDSNEAVSPTRRIQRKLDASFDDEGLNAHSNKKARRRHAKPSSRLPISRPISDPIPRHITDPEFRSFDGSDNNPQQPQMGAANTQLARMLPSDYLDGIAALPGVSRPNPRSISNAVSAQSGSIKNKKRASDFLWQWGQFVDHDIDLTDGVSPAEPANIPVPQGDPDFDPNNTGSVVMRFNRSIYDPSTGTSAANPRQQLNEISTWIDASNVYGSNAERAKALRKNDGSGQMKTSRGRLLPFNTPGLPNAGGSSEALFLAGDVRANEQTGLTALHTLFVREHNRRAKRLKRSRPWLTGEQIYQRARRIVGAEMQAITYNEYLPALLGPDGLAPYSGYKADVDASITNLFSGALYRYGHSALSPQLKRINRRGKETHHGHLALREAFFSPKRLTDEGGIEPVLRGLANQVCQMIDPYVIDDVRNFLFGPPGAGGFDLASLNIQRGRDHGLPTYNEARAALGLGRIHSLAFEEITSDPALQQKLEDVYTSVDNIDLWVGGLAEDRLPGAMVGELVATVLKKQFEALRDGDRFWYENSLNRRQIRSLKRLRLSDVIRRNTSIRYELPRDVFHVKPPRPWWWGYFN